MAIVRRAITCFHMNGDSTIGSLQPPVHTSHGKAPFHGSIVKKRIECSGASGRISLKSRNSNTPRVREFCYGLILGKQEFELFDKWPEFVVHYLHLPFLCRSSVGRAMVQVFRDRLRILPSVVLLPEAFVGHYIQFALRRQLAIPNC